MMNKHCGFACAILAVAFVAAPTPALASWWNNDWSYRKEVVLDGTPQGASLEADLEQVPVLIRLHDGVFRFIDANPDGSDLRFVASDDKTPLKYHIEKFDPVFNLAFIWVAVPRLTTAQPVKLWMYYGNPKAASESDARALYDSAQAVVYHFADRSAPGNDATGYANHAVTSPAVEEEGLIGSAARFSGAESLALPSAPALAMTAGMSRTLMFWAKPDAAGQTAVIFQQGDATAGVTLGLEAGVPYVTIRGSGPQPQTVAAAEALTARWHHLALVTAAATTTLYVDGQPVAPVPVGVPATAVPAALGQAAAAVFGEGVAAYAGLLDELSLANVERAAEFIRVAALNQGASDKLVRFGGDEALSTWESGYFAIILKSVTLDGWVVIGILAVMSLISIVVMISKLRQIGRVSRGNGAFLKLFQESQGDFIGLSKLFISEVHVGDKRVDRLRKAARGAPLTHIFATGVEELRGRLAEEGNGGHISAESIEAIRATLDSSVVSENQALNSQMVMLTIAISGGPFLGLLGTVVGVMITFAAIAASGDVNINAIAPGIAAALVATVAGLAVAIPALFGYNYLTTRINEASARMQVFLDAFITRMAEYHNSPRELRAMGART